jgi:hypothetical protein
VLLGKGLRDELITRPEESYRLWCVVVGDLETTKVLVNEEEAKVHWGAIAPREKKIQHIDMCTNLNYVISSLLVAGVLISL